MAIEELFEKYNNLSNLKEEEKVSFINDYFNLDNIEKALNIIHNLTDDEIIELNHSIVSGNKYRLSFMKDYNFDYWLVSLIKSNDYKVNTITYDIGTIDNGFNIFNDIDNLDFIYNTLCQRHNTYIIKELELYLVDLIPDENLINKKGSR